MAPNSSSATVRSGSFKPAISSPQWQMFLYLHSYYFAAFMFTEIMIFIWKSSILPYSIDILSTELLLLFLLAAVEISRIFWGMKGNLTERRLPCMTSIAVSVPCVVGALYFLLWQFYVLRLEAVIIIVHMVFIVLETVFAIVTFVGIQNSVTS